MEIGILGLPQSGKSTLFQIMTGVNSINAHSEKYLKGVAKVPDTRFSTLVEIFNPAKATPATIPFIDVNASGKNAWNAIRQSLNGVDGILHIVDGFTTSDLNEIVKNYQTLTDDLVLSDLMIIENRLERIKKTSPKSMGPSELTQATILPKAQEILESGKRLKDLPMSDDEIASIRGFDFWTLRSELVVLNTSEDKSNIQNDFIEKTKLKIPVISICCQIEAEIASLSKDDQKDFLISMGIETPAFEKIIKTAFSLLDQISYFTVGEDEVKAWVIPSGSTAPRAAAAIHKDFERGFIKAEVVSYDDFIASGKTLGTAKSSGKLRLEGKDYIVKDGDIINFRFNV